MASINVLEDIRNTKFQSPDTILGKGAMMPFAASNSGSRKLMFGTQLEHRLSLINPDVPFIQTGYEKQFGTESSSYIKTKDNETLEVLGTVAKFSWLPKHHYYLFAINDQKKEIKMFERKEYKHITESYGYLYNNDVLDNLQPGSIIHPGSPIQMSQSFDEYGNRMDGKNLLTMYNACEHTIEDAILISESAAKKLASPLVKKVNIVINDNDIPLNIYGNNEIYKIFPDIGECTKNNILCGFRREKKEECLYSQSYSRLRELAISDDKYFASERVVDIDIYCNAPDKLASTAYNDQLKRYYDNHIFMCQQIIELLEPFDKAGYQMEYSAKRLYTIAKKTIEGKGYFSEKVFSNIVLEITLIDEINVEQGDKLSNRYGGKGITSRIVPDELMPRTQTGEIFDIILNMCGVYGRENAGQLFEISISYVCIKLLQYIQLNVLDIGATIELYMKLLSIVAPSMVKETEDLLEGMTDDECIDYITNACAGEKSMYLLIKPMSENMTIDKVDELYKAFPWIKPEKILTPIRDSVGKLKYIPSNRPIVYGYQYIYRLKQYAEEKFSVTSLSATNIRNENSKSKSSNQYKALYSRTPIRFGDMETGNLIHLGAELVIQMLMIYSTSPHARRLTSELLTGDPFNIDVKLDLKSKNRNAEILNVYLKTMGLRLVFKRVPKKITTPILTEPFIFFGENANLKPGMIFSHPDEKVDIKEWMKRITERDKYTNGIEFIGMEFYSDDMEKFRKDYNLPPDPYLEWLKENPIK